MIGHPLHPARRAGAVVATAALALVAAAALPAHAADETTTTSGTSTTAVPSDTDTPTITAFDAFPLDPVQPVLGADDQQHLAYELRIANVSKKTITMDRVDVVDAKETSKVVQTVAAATIQNLLHVDGGALTNVDPPGTGGVPFEFTKFTGEGVITNIGPLQTGAVATVEPQNDGPHTKELPLYNEVIDFGS
jgi:hypothetical protein